MMTKPSVLRKLESGYYKIIVKNDKVYLPEKEYNVHHIYLVGFSKASLFLKSSRVEGEIDYNTIPSIDFMDEVLSIISSKQPTFIHRYEESFYATENSLKGESKPLSIRISEESEYIITVNDKYVYKGSSIELKMTCSNSVLNMLTYPFRVVWIYTPNGYLTITNRNEHVEISVREN